MTLSPKIPMVDEEDTLTHSDIESRIKGIDEKMESANQRIMEIDQQSQDIQQQLKAIRENVETTASQVPDTLASDVKSEAAADDTEEDAELTATPIEVDVEAEEKSLSYPAPPKREMRINVARKRARPVSEIEEERENARVRIWRLLKELPIKVEEVKLEYELEHDIVIPISTNELRTIEKVEDLSDHEESAALHQQIRHAMFRTLHLRKKRQHWRQAKLRRKYRQQYIVWQNHMDKLDAQRQSEMERLGLQPPKVEAPATPRIEGVTPSTPNTELLTLDLSGGTRGTRRAQQAAHARDYVQSEAEFLELMASLGTEEKDPTAEIPPMLPPDERNLIDFDETGLVHDPVTFYTRALFTVEEGTKFDVQGWLDEEDKAYMRRLSIAGKQFGRFKRAAPLQHRSVQELVQHYYFLKGDGEGLDWRSVIAGKNRYGKGAVGRPSAASVLIGSGAPSGKPRSAGRGRGRTRSNNPVPLLQPKSKDDDDDDSRSIIDDDADDSGSMTAGGVRTARAKKGRVIESTAAKQRPKRVAAPAAPKEKVGFCKA
jgi:DNA-binding FrmR family transcriptional regulator